MSKAEQNNQDEAGSHLDVEIAIKIMGWTTAAPHNGQPTYENKTTGHHPIYAHKLPCYSADISAAMEVENRIEELGLEASYARELAKGTPHWLFASDEATWWHVAHATPEQRCRAALVAIQESASAAALSPNVERQGSAQPSPKEL